jgi:transposase-like protein
MARRTPNAWPSTTVTPTGSGALSRRGRAAYPQAAQGLLLPSFLEPRLLAGKAPTDVVAGGLCPGGFVSTRSVDDLVQAMGMTGISNSQVRRLCGEIDDKVGGLPRPSDRGCVAVSVDRHHLREGTPEWPQKSR